MLFKEITIGRKLFKNLAPLETAEPWGFFSTEIDKSGRRYFFAAKYSTLFSVFPYLPELHIYEVIPDGHPCHLYFDIEFIKEENPNLDGDSLVNSIIDVCIEKLSLMFSISSIQTINLDATTERKFSRHLILRDDSFCFEDNRHVGTFVFKEIISNPEFARIVDPAVYSRNRNFRCVWSSKFANGGKAALRPYDPDGGDQNSYFNASTAEFFMKTLICNVKQGCRHIHFEENDLIPWNLENRAVQSKLSASKQPKDGTARVIELEEYVISRLAPGGYVSKVDYSPEFDTILIGVAGNRFCRNIGRQHKHNNIYIVCKLGVGVMSQRCYDPDCRAFESAPEKIPDGILAMARKSFQPNPSALVS